MAQRGCATPRIADELVLVPPWGSPHRRSTCPGCENALPDAERCWPRSHRGGAPTRMPPRNVEHHLDERTRPDHEAPACTRALPHRQKKSPGCEQPGDCLEPGLDQLRIFSGRIRKRASAGSSHRAPNMFHRNMKVSRIPMSAWNLMSEKIQVATPMARVKPVKVTALPVVFSVS